jgi:hypothetical protein
LLQKQTISGTFPFNNSRQLKKVNILIKILFIAACIFSALGLSAQDKLLFLNGKQFEGKLIEKTNYEFTFKTDKEKQYIIDKYRLFSYTQNNKETIVYEFDTLSGNFLKVKDMQLFVYGERDAHKSYSSTFVNITGLAFGGVAGYLMNRDQSFVYVPAPLAFTVLTLPFGTRVRQNKIKDLQYLKEDEYLRGYERIARSKRTQNALKSSLVGMAAGFIIGAVTNSSK